MYVGKLKRIRKRNKTKIGRRTREEKNTSETNETLCLN